MRLDRLSERRKEAGRPDLQLLSVFLGEGVVRRAEREDNHNRLGEDLSKYLVVRKGDLVFNKLRTWQGGLGASRYDGIVSPAYFVLRPGRRVSPDFLQHLLLSSPYLAELTRRSKWMPPSQFDIPWHELKTLPVLLPPVETQRTIAGFLDQKTAAIDALISKKERLMGLLEERHQALTAEAVTKGLNRRVALRPSGTAWLGDIPEHWASDALGRLVTVLGGATPRKDEPAFWGGDIPWVSPKDMKRAEITDSEDHLSAAALSATSIRLIEPPAVLIVVSRVLTNDPLGSIGR